MRVALLTNILAPYRMPAFRALAQTPGWTVRVFVNAESEFDRSWTVLERSDVEQLVGRPEGSGLFEIGIDDPRRAATVAARASKTGTR